jgi:hypothetical protein
MTALLARRSAALTGLVLAAAVALWWLGSARLALEQGSDARHCSAAALQVLWWVRALVLALQGPRVAAVAGWRAGAVAALGLIAPAWPLVVLAWSASTVAWNSVAAAELLLLVAAAALPALGWGLRRRVPRPELGELAATTLAVALAAALWALRGLWPWF